MISGYLLGEQRLIRGLETLPQRSKARLDATMQALGMELESRVKTNYLVGPRPGKLGVVTGRLRSSITRGSPESRSRFVSTPTSSMYYVGTNVEYGKFWEYGTAGRTIVAKNALALRFEIGGSVFFRKSVYVPPQAPRPFLQPALQDMRALAQYRIAKVLRESAVENLKP